MTVSSTSNACLKAKIFTLLGSILNRLGIYNKALEYHKKSEGLNKSLIDIGSKVRVARDYQNIGWVYSNLRELDQALENHYKSLHEYREINDEAGTARENRLYTIEIKQTRRSIRVS